MFRYQCWTWILRGFMKVSVNFETTNEVNIAFIVKFALQINM
jgi:hypothetical protein